ncbi:two-component hybrid sensor and regulator [Filimonas lacunae]|nr:two-component hybrid sensor and regulator [Filimonas lacunae]
MCFALFCTAGVSAPSFPVKYLGIEQGLSNNAVTSIYQDHRGFMWFGTYDGLNRFDGYNFTIFRNKIEDTSSLSTANIFSMDGDSQHNLWIGGQKGANIFNPATGAFTVPRFIALNDTRQQPLQDDIHCIKAINAQCVLLGSRHNGLLAFEQASRHGWQVALPGGAAGNAGNYNVTAIEYDTALQQVWVCIQQAGLFQYHIANRTLTLVNAGIRNANSLKKAGNGNLWVGTDNGLYLYNTRTQSFSGNVMTQPGNVVSLCEDHARNLWIATDGSGVWLLPQGNQQAQPLVNADKTPVVNSNAVYAIYEDKEGRKWISTLRGGINLIAAQAQPFTNMVYNAGKQQNPTENFILSFCEDAQKNLWIGTDGAGLRYWNRNANTYTTYTRNSSSNSLSSNFITGITHDYNNDIWVSTWFGGVNRLHRNSNTFEHYNCINPITRAVEPNVWLVYEDKQKCLWASTTNDGSLYYFNRAQNSFLLFDPSLVNLQCLAEDRSGHLWGGNYHSLIQIDRQQKQHRTFTIGYPIRSIYESSRRQLWVGTQGGGLLLFTPSTGQYKRFTTADGLPGNTILRLLEDECGNLWLSTYNGLCKFNPATGYCQNFSSSDGLQSNQFSFNAGLALSSGEFLFGGIKGFNIFYPHQVTTHTTAPAVYISGIQVSNNPIDKHPSYIDNRNGEAIEQISIPYNQAALTLDYTALEYGHNDKIKYAYYLEGWDKGWNYVNNIRSANYSRLREGSYTFKLKVTNAYGQWSNETALLQITILPPWYRTWWAMLLYMLCGSALIYLYIRYTRRQERLKYEIQLAHIEHEKDKEITEKKLSFFTNISHEFRTPLTLIINPLKEKIHQQGGQADTDITIAYRNARRLLSLVDQLLLFRKADSGEDKLHLSAFNIIELGKEVHQCFIQQARAKNITYQFNYPASTIELHGDYEKIEIALFNLLSNAFKFTPDGGTIVFDIAEEEHTVTLRVKDNGCGINAADMNTIFQRFQQSRAAYLSQKSGFGIGLYLVKHFVESHQGTVQCQSTAQQGTSFTIKLHKGIAHLPHNYLPVAAAPKCELLEELAIDSEPTSLPDPEVTLEGKTAEEVVTDKKSILLIDDDQEIRRYLHHLFDKKYLLYEAADGQEGLELAEAHVPDLIISDIQMKNMNGIDMCRIIKQSEKLGHIPVILLTASADNSRKLEGIEGGAEDYITKPFDSDILQARLETLLRNRSLLQRYFFDNITLKESNIKVPAEYQDFLKRCIAVVEENIDREDFTIKKFARELGISHSGLYQKVKSISGQSPNAFIRSIRLRRAAVLLLTENMNITQAAFQVRINDIKYFREQFVKLFGVTPSQYIRKYRYSFNNTHNTVKTGK